MQHQVYHGQMNSSDELKQQLIDVWCGLEQLIYDETIDQWRGRYRMCVCAKQGQQHMAICSCQGRQRQHTDLAVSPSPELVSGISYLRLCVYHRHLDSFKAS